MVSIVITSDGPCYDTGWVSSCRQFKELSSLWVALIKTAKHTIQKKTTVVHAVYDNMYNHDTWFKT